MSNGFESLLSGPTVKVLSLSCGEIQDLMPLANVHFHLRHSNAEVDDGAGLIERKHAAVGNDLPSAHRQAHRGVCQRFPDLSGEGSIVDLRSDALPVRLPRRHDNLSHIIHSEAPCQMYLQLPLPYSSLLVMIVDHGFPVHT